jgi:hypothetical protein
MEGIPGGGCRGVGRGRRLNGCSYARARCQTVRNSELRSSGGFISQGGEGRLVIEVTGYPEVRADVLYWSCG